MKPLCFLVRRYLSQFILISLLLLTGCDTQSIGPGASAERSLTVLYTNDEHGWMEGVTPQQGAANLFGLWQAQEGYTEEGPFLVLSGGDNWTGPAISTTVSGASMVDVMNSMHYAATAVGNHEFDFGLDVMSQRIEEADFPYLSANVHWRETGRVPTDLGIQPFTIIEVNELRVGIIGLTTTSTPRTTMPSNVTALEFDDYAVALRETVPHVRAQNVDLLFVIAHVCMAPIHQLAETIADLNIQMIGGGHCNELEAGQVNDIVVLGGGSRLATYAKATFHYDTQRKQLTDVEYSVHQNELGVADGAVNGIIEKWQQQIGSIMSVVIGYNEMELPRGGELLQQSFINSWLLADTTADVAISNAGGIRAALPAGEITVGTVYGLMPFENTIIATSLTGAELQQVLVEGRLPLVAGLTLRDSAWLDKNGSPLDDDKYYRVLVNSFMYAGGDGYEGLANFDPDGFDTGINYRQPFLDWLSAQQSTSAQPLQF